MYRFEFRFEKQLKDEIERVRKILGITISRLISNALEEAISCYIGGKFHYRKKSDFLLRKSFSDKKRFEFVLEEDLREILRNIAFTWRISQAEAVRVMVEHYVYVIYGKTDEIRAVYVQKIRYNIPIAAPMVVVYDIFNVIEKKYRMFRPPKNWTMNFA